MKNKIKSNNINMNSVDNKSHILIMPYGMFCNYDMFLKAGYSKLDNKPERILFIVPTYNYCFSSLMGMAAYEFAEIEDYSNFDRDFYMDLRVRYNIHREPFIFEREEILYPHITYLREHMPERKLLPLFYNNIKEGVIKSLIEDLREECCFVFLSFMSLGYSYDEAKDLDELNAKKIEQNKADDITHMEFSAFKILPDLMEYNRVNDYKFRRIALQNSADYTDKSKDKTIGYGAWYLTEQ